MLILHRRDGVISVARMLCCARSSVGQWINWFTFYGTEVLVSLPYCPRIVSSHLFWKRSISLNKIPDALHSSSALGIAIRFSFLCDSRINRGGGCLSVSRSYVNQIDRFRETISLIASSISF